MGANKTESLLKPLRVLDLTEGGCMIAGKILADLGADVIKVEPPDGSPSRQIGPFYGNTPDPERSLFWFAYNTNKRSITIDLETDEGKGDFLKLSRRADFVLESFEPGYLDNRGMGYEALSRINPRIILTSITPFGYSGPYAGYKSSDLVIWAMGGFLGVTGVDPRPPVWVGFPQASLHAGNNAAASSLMAHWYREKTGEGRHIQVSAQACVVIALYGVPRWWEYLKIERSSRQGGYIRYLNADPGARAVYPCKDGEVLMLVQGGSSVVHHRSSANLVKYMAENKMASAWLKNFDWIHDYDAATITQETLDCIEEEVVSFIKTKTKIELHGEALKRRILLAPFNNARDVYESAQLHARDFWVDVEHPELEGKVKYCGPFIKLSDAPISTRRRPPLTGEHNEEIYEELSATMREPVVSNPKMHGSKGGRAGGKHALEGLKIADFTWSIVGPLTGKHLADHGATVVRVESHTRPGVNRVGGPYKDNIPGLDRSSLFTLYNTSKYGMSLNLDKPKALEVARRLMLWSDVVLESFSPGVMGSFGLDYETIRKEKPDIIYVSTSCYGQYGPIANTPGFGQMATAQSGITNMIGWPDMPTVTNTLPHTDFISPPFLISTIMAALDYRNRTGKGISMEQSQLEAGVHFFAPPVMDYMVNGHVMVRDGNHYPYASPHAVYPCRGENRWCAISIFSDEEWHRFCEATGNPSWTKDERFATLTSRKENEKMLDRLVGEWTVNFTPREVMERLQEKGIAAGVVQSPKELYEDPQLEHFGFWRYLDHPEMGVHAHQGPPFILTGTTDRQFTAPCLGQHNEYVYGELLGYTDEEIEEFLMEGVISTDADITDFKSSF